jgi:hypothetical protein
MKGTFQFLRNFQVQFNLIFSEKIYRYSRPFALQVQMSWNQAHAPLLVKSFPKTPRIWFEASWFGGFHNYKTKQSVTNTHALPWIDKMLYMCIHVCIQIYILFYDLFVCVCVYVHLCVYTSVIMLIINNNLSSHFVVLCGSTNWGT